MASHNQLPSSSSPTKTPLANLSPNTTSPTKSKPHKSHPEPILPLKDENAPLNNIHQQQQQQQGSKQTSYISPSDNIMSPTTKKLSAIKGRRFGSAAVATKPQSLFAKTLGKQALRSEENLGAATATTTTISSSVNNGGGAAVAEEEAES